MDKSLLDKKVDTLIANRTKENLGLFDNDDLENILIKAVSLQFDTKLPQNEPSLISKPLRCSLSDFISDIRAVGVTIPAPNREYIIDTLDERIDTYPESFCFFDYANSKLDGSPEEYAKDGYREDSFVSHKIKPAYYYASAYFIKRIDKMPPFWGCEGVPDKIYWCYSFRTEQKSCDFYRWVGAFDKNNEILCTYFRDKFYDSSNYRGSSTIKRYGEHKKYFSETLSLLVQMYNDNQYLWNVTAIEGDAKINVCCYRENIKSLFYARELPITETGRKRPILHWVRAHKRRLEKGVDIDIKRYLRGVTEIEMGKTKFIIAPPTRNPQ